MLKSSPDPNLISLSTSLYRVLLAFYPVGFKRDYGPHMAQVFRDCCLKVYRQSGPTGMLSLWALTLFDWFKTVVEEQLNRGTEMTREKFIRFSGWGLTLGGLTHALGFITSNSQSFFLRNFGLRYSTTERASEFLIIGSTILLVIGILGLFLRLENQARRGEKLPLIGGMVFGLVNVLAGLSLFPFESDVAWGIWFSSFLLVFVSLAAFGIIALRKDLLDRWRALPLLAGVPWPAATIVIAILERYYGAWEVPFTEIIGLVAILITAAALVLLGYGLQSDTEGEGFVALPNTPGGNPAG